jgi:co-chaperonin GroES (HSP10)
VKAVAGNVVTLVTDPPAKETVTITVADGAKVQQLAVGSTDLKTATPAQLSDIAVGDRVLAAGKAGDAAGSFTASRVILMKSSDIAQMQAAQQADWKKNGVGGIVTAIDPASGTVTITSGAKKIAVQTGDKTDFKRFARDSEKYQDALPGTLAQIHVGDQLQARGTKSADGSSVQAVEVLSGAFLDLSGLVASVDAAAGSITLKDLGTKKVVTVAVTPNTDIRTMPRGRAEAEPQQSALRAQPVRAATLEGAVAAARPILRR